MKYTAEEVRARFEAWLIREHEYAPEDLIRHEKRNCYADYATHLAWNAYRDAYADLLERIKADKGACEKAAVIWQYRRTSDAQWLDCDELDADVWKQTGLHEVRKVFTHPPAQAAQGDASLGRCKACGRATRAVCDGLDGNGLGCTNAPSIDLAAVREVIAYLRSFRSNTPPTWAHLDDAADKLEAALQENTMTAPSLLDELEGVMRLAEKATPGEWTATVGHDVKQQHGVTVMKAWAGRGPQQEHNAAYVVALVNWFRTHHAELADMAKRLEAADKLLREIHAGDDREQPKRRNEALDRIQSHLQGADDEA